MARGQLPASYVGVREGRTLRVPARSIARHGYYEPAGTGADRVKFEKAVVAIVDGQRHPVKIVVGPDLICKGRRQGGRWEVSDGRHRLRVAIELDAKVLVAFYRGVDGVGHGAGLTYVKR